MWKKAAQFVSSKLSKLDAQHAEVYSSNLESYLDKLDSVELVIDSILNQVPEESKVIVTAHDAFNYLGQKYDYEVLGLQGISTVSEAGVQDVQKLAQMIVERKIKAIFVESSVPRRNIEALQAAVKAKGFEVNIGGELFSDALGSPGTPEGTYLGMLLHNATTIANALK